MRLINGEECSSPEEMWCIISNNIESNYTRWKSTYHTLSIAYVGDALAPTLATVVLRHFDGDQKTLRFHTDSRSAKFNAKVLSAMHYHRDEPWQVRYQGIPEINHMDETALSRWETLTNAQKKCYQIDYAPGTVIDTMPGYHANGLDHFAIITLRMTAIDMLYLHHQGHIRARLTFNDGKWSSCWLSP